MLFSLVLWGCTSNPLEHPDFQEPPESALQVSVSVPTGLRVGEPIPVEVTVTSKEGKHPFDVTENSPRGRVSLDDWMVRPNQDDPGVFWEDRAARGPASRKTVSPDAPLTYTVFLNDWVRFDSPGAYGVQLQTRRAGKQEIRSIPVLVSVEARDAAADAQRLQALLGKVSSEDEAAAALSEIRWMGASDTIEPALAGIEAASGAVQREWMHVLSSHPDVDAVREALNRRMDQAEGVVVLEHIEAVAAATYNESFDSAIGAYRASGPDPVRIAYGKEVKARTASLEAGRAALMERLISSLPKKDPAARGHSLGAVAEALVKAQQTLSWEEAGWKAVREGFVLIPLETRSELLKNHWHAIAHPDLAKAVGETIRDPGLSAAVRGTSLARLAKLDSAAAEPVLLALLDDPKRKVSREGLKALLSLKTVPEGTRAGIVDRLDEAEDRSVQLALIGAYADASSADAIWKAYQSEPAPMTDVLLAGYASYFLRIDDPRAARILDRHGPENPQLLLETGALTSKKSELIRRALVGLRSADDGVRVHSSETICEYADASVIPELLRIMIGSKDGTQEATVTALTTSRAFTLSRALRAEVLRQIDDPRAETVMRSTVAAEQNGVVLPFSMPEGELVMKINYREYVGLEAIQDKLSQFSKDAIFKAQWRDITPEEGFAMTRELFANIDAHLYTPALR